jgi:hypothetical protein
LKGHSILVEINSFKKIETKIRFVMTKHTRRFSWSLIGFSFRRKLTMVSLKQCLWTLCLASQYNCWPSPNPDMTISMPWKMES